MLDGKVAIVTGGATGIGAATSRLLAEKGAHVVVTSEQPAEAIQDFADGIVAGGGKASALRCDVTDPAAIAALVAGVEKAHDRIDILVNCAGLCFFGPVEEMEPAKVRKMFAVNATGPIALIAAVLPIMRRLGGGAIVNVSSGAAEIGVEGLAAYAASKSALRQFTRTIAPELKRSGIRINAVGPGSVRTPMLGYTSDELTPDQQAGMARREAGTVSPYGNAIMDPTDIADVILFLVSDQARGLQGAFVLADQGFCSTMKQPAAPS
jgi:NAD(P)-dependent dehydrogenase (short-subunit alcohol dehydrogenase family)